MAIFGSLIDSAPFPDPVVGYEPRVTKNVSLDSLPKETKSPTPPIESVPTKWGEWIVHETLPNQHLSFGFKHSEIKILSLMVSANVWPAIFIDQSDAEFEFYSTEELYYYVGMRAKKVARDKLNISQEKTQQRQERVRLARIQKREAELEENAEKKRRKLQEKWGPRSSNQINQAIRETLQGT